MTKLIGAILVVSSSSALGFYFSNELITRINNLKEIKKILILLRGDIQYANTALPEAIQALSRRHNGVYKRFLKNLSEKLLELKGKSFALIWREGVKKDLYRTSLVKEDYDLLNQLGYRRNSRCFCLIVQYRVCRHDIILSYNYNNCHFHNVDRGGPS